MARAIHRLSSGNLKTSIPGYYADGGNLYFRVADGGGRGWMFRYVSPVTGKTRDMGLGVSPRSALPPPARWLSRTGNSLPPGSTP